MEKEKKRSKKTSKKEVKKLNFYLMIYDRIKKNIPLKDICFELEFSKQKLHYYTNKLKDEGFIKNVGYSVWEVTSKNPKEVKTFSLGSRVDKPLTNLHALQINIPIIKGKIYDKDWQVNEKLKNWIPKYKKFNILGGLTIKNNNNKSITIFAKSRNIKDLDEIYQLTFKITAFVNDYFKKEGVFLDVFNAKVKNLNIATEDKKAESMIRKGEKFELNLNKKSEKILPKDDINAKAWIDGSPFKFSAETNDLEWKREYLSMPFRIKDTMTVLDSMAQNLAYVAENYKSHVKMVEEGSKIFKKLNRRLDQKNLKDYF